jgi:hypothetical protein
MTTPFSLSHWMLASVLLVFIPAWIFSRTVTKAGFSGWWVLTTVFPPFGLLMLWLFAFSNWPNYPDLASSAAGKPRREPPGV